ncbi:MAG: diacylglycerol kinase family lipid kinase [Alistipes sp.]|nr:diacylglycerol kinase family lipid kinase [Alistipes sp.]
MDASISTKWFAIVNPVAGSGKGLADWPLISRLLRDQHITPEYVFTEHKYHATELAVEAVRNGFRKIIVVGGDGTIHEVVNGLFIQQEVPTTEVLLSVIAVGTGNDWIRMFGIPRKYSEAIRAIAEGYSFLQDVGRLSYYQASYPQSRYMANVAGVGFDAYVNRRYNHLKEEGRRGKWLYLWSTLKAVLKYSSTGVKIYVDDTLVVNDLVYSATIGIGKYNGGGMLQTPDAIADDGLFDLTVIRKMSRLSVLAHFKVLFNGKIYQLETTSLNRGRKIRIESSPEIAVEVDGEALGYSPFEFEIIDRAVRVVVAHRFLEEQTETPVSHP